MAKQKRGFGVSKNNLIFIGILFAFVVLLGNPSIVGNFWKELFTGSINDGLDSQTERDNLLPPPTAELNSPSAANAPTVQAVAPYLGPGKELGQLNNGNNCKKTSFTGPSSTGTSGCQNSFKDACNKALAAAKKDKQAECTTMANKERCEVGKLENCYCKLGKLGSPNVCYSRGDNDGCIAHVGGATCDCVGYKC